MSGIRWGILGTGIIAHQFARGLKLVPEASLYAVGSRTISKAKAFANEFGAKCFYDSYQDFVNDPNIDVVYIATPHNYHQEHCLLCLEANKPVLCEKPFTSNASEAAAVINVARAKNLFCMEAMWMRFIPLIKEVKRLVKEKKIGEISLLQANIGYPFVVDQKSRMFDPALDASVISDLGVYPISLAFYLLGAPKNITCYTNTGQTYIDDQATIILEYPQQLAALSCSYRTETSNDAIIAGSKGRIHIQTPLLNPESAIVSQFSPLVPNAGSSSGGLKAFIKSIPLAKSFFNYLKSASGKKSQTINLPFAGTGIQYEIEEVVHCLQRGETESAIMPLNETLEIMKLIDKIREKRS